MVPGADESAEEGSSRLAYRDKVPPGLEGVESEVITTNREP